MAVLDLSSLNIKKLNDIYYMESLSFDNLPEGGFKQISAEINKFRKNVGNNFKTKFNGTLESFDSKNNTLNYQFQAHDCYDLEIKVSLDKKRIQLKTISNSFKDQEEYNVKFDFLGLSNLKSELSIYSKGKLNIHRDCDFDILFNQKNFSFRDFLIIDNEKLESEIKMIFVYIPEIKHTDFGDREILTLTFIPSKIHAEITKVSKLDKNKNLTF